MRKAIKLCLALAMAGSMAVGTAFAGETTAAVHGEAEFYFKNNTADYQDASGDKKSYSSMEMSHEGGLYLDGSNKGDVWTTTFGIGIWLGESSVVLDAANLGLANDAYSLNFGSSDLGDATKNPGYYGGSLYDVGDELSKGGSGITFSMPDVGFAGYLAMNEASGAQTTAYAFSYDKVMGDIDLSVEYETASTSIDKSKSPSSVNGVNDGASATDLGIGVKYSMGEMAVMFNYGMTSNTPGGKTTDPNTSLLASTKATETSTMMLIFDMALDEASGVSAVYQSRVTDDKNDWNFASATAATQTQGQKTTATTLGAGYKTTFNGAMWIKGYYSMMSTKSDNGDFNTFTGVTSKVDYATKTKSDTTLGLEVGMSFY
jgi:hypothetical protein